jgi:hypothetical protein
VQLVGDLAGPAAGAQLPDEQRIRKLVLGEQRVARPRVDRGLVRVQRGVDRDVAVDRRNALQAQRGVCRAAADDPGERQGAAAGADDLQLGRLGDKAGREVVVALECCEGTQPAVLLGRDGLEDDVAGEARSRRSQRRERVQHRHDAALHVDRTAAMHGAAGDLA